MLFCDCLNCHRDQKSNNLSLRSVSSVFPSLSYLKVETYKKLHELALSRLATYA